MPRIPSIRKKHLPLATEMSQQNDLTAEEFPDGPYGASLIVETMGKSSPWRKGQRPPNTYTFENRELHEGMERGMAPDHPTHDDPDGIPD